MRWALIGALAACSAETTTTFGERAQEMAVCADGPTVYGIDVSRFQGDIDWQQVADSGVKYAFIQISRSVTDLDMKFDYNWRRAKEVGILRGAYQRFQPDESVEQQARIFLDTLGPYQEGDLPPVLDVEDQGGLGPAQIAAKVKQWMDIVEPVVGVKPIIYTGFYFWRDMVGGADFDEHPLWIANYGTDCPLVPPTWSRWALHQYSSTARIPGITANTVDVNKFNGTLAELKALGKPVNTACPAIDDANPVVDDASPCFRAGGPQQFIRNEPAGFGGSLQWTNATDSATAANFGEWSLNFAAAGRYRVEAHTPAPYNESKQAVYRIQHAGQTTEATLDQSAADGWQPLGELEFAAGAMQSVRVDDNTGEASADERSIVFDALRFTRLPDGNGGEPATETTSDCSTSRGGSSFAIGIALLAVLRRRRAR